MRVFAHHTTLSVIKANNTTLTQDRKRQRRDNKKQIVSGSREMFEKEHVQRQLDEIEVGVHDNDNLMAAEDVSDNHEFE